MGGNHESKDPRADWAEIFGYQPSHFVNFFSSNAVLEGLAIWQQEIQCY
jgi:hypothetical protein